MALTLKDMLTLPALKCCTVIAGENGLNKDIITAGIVDYEFAENIKNPRPLIFIKESLLISSLLFAKDKPELILPAVEKLNSLGVTALIYKSVVFDELPDEVISYANKNAFPILTYREGPWFENIIFEVMAAVEKDDARYLSEINLEKMIRSSITEQETENIRSGISLLLNRAISAAYIKTEGLDPAHAFSLYYMSKSLREKIIIAQYDGGIFILITDRRSDESAHRLILKVACQTLYLPVNTENITLSRLHSSTEIGKAVQEAYMGWIAGLITLQNAIIYDYLGAYSAILPLAGTPELRSFSSGYMNMLTGYESTIKSYVQNHGDAIATAVDLDCHPNTIRYRLNKMKELVGAKEETDHELFRDLSIAYAVDAMLKYNTANKYTPGD